MLFFLIRIQALASLESTLPSWELDLVRHLVRHLPERIKRVGPLWSHSMFPFERMWKLLGRIRTSHKNPSLTIMLHYRATRISNNIAAKSDHESEENKEAESEGAV